MLSPTSLMELWWSRPMHAESTLTWFLDIPMYRPVFLTVHPIMISIHMSGSHLSQSQQQCILSDFVYWRYCGLNFKSSNYWILIYTELTLPHWFISIEFKSSNAFSFCKKIYRGVKILTENQKHKNKEAFQSNAKRPFANRCVGCVVKKIEQVWGSPCEQVWTGRGRALGLELEVRMWIGGGRGQGQVTKFEQVWWGPHANCDWPMTSQIVITWGPHKSNSNNYKPIQSNILIYRPKYNTTLKDIIHHYLL